MTENVGIDYGNGMTNIDRDTGIRYGVISSHEVGQAWYEDSEGEYGEATCPKCGDNAVDFDGDNHDDFEYEEYSCADYACEECAYVFDAQCAFPETPYSFYYENDEYRAYQGGDASDIFVERSPYFTYAQFCSPCAPGACYLMNPVYAGNDNNRCYCFGHSWFEGDIAPYTVYSVETGGVVAPE